MGWEHILALVLGNGALIIPLFLWNRAESRADIRHMDYKIDVIRTENKDSNQETRELIKAIHDEIKDFHARLCVIEERNREKK